MHAGALIVPGQYVQCLSYQIHRYAVDKTNIRRSRTKVRICSNFGSMLHAMRSFLIILTFHINVIFVVMLARSSPCKPGPSLLQCGDSAESIQDCVSGYIDSVANDTDLFKFGPYLTLTRDNGIRAEALADLANLITPLLIFG